MSHSKVSEINVSPVELHQFQNIPPQDAAIRFLASQNHPLQRKRLFRSHKQRLDEFVKDTALQWDNETYVNQRYTQASTIYATPEIQKNIDTARPTDAGNNPARRRPSKVSDTKLSINELQLALSNQAAALRMEMTSEYEDMRGFQNSELEYLIKQKEAKDPKFQSIVEDVKKHGLRPTLSRSVSSSSKIPKDQNTPNTPTSVRSPIAVQAGASPLQTMSPSELPDLTHLKNDPSLPPFVKFFLDLKVVRSNWAAISQNWPNYVSIFSRKLMTEHAFARAILEDAIRAHNKDKFPVNMAYIRRTREIWDQHIKTQLPITRIIGDVVLDMAQEGLIEADEENNEKETFGPNILRDATELEAQTAPSAPIFLARLSSVQNVGKATDPRLR